MRSLTPPASPRSAPPAGRGRECRRVVAAALATALAVAAGTSGSAPATAALGLATGVAAGSSTAAVAGDCSDVLVVGLTGSGRTIDAAEPFGPMLEPVRDRLLRSAVRAGRTVEQVHLGGHTAPVRVLKKSRRASGPASTAISRASVREWEGDLTTRTARLVDRLERAAETCPDQQLVLAGYAQGAMAVHRALNALQDTPAVTDRIVGAVLVSDGDRTPDTSAVRLGAPASGPSGSGVHPRFFRARADTPPVAWSVCTKGDVVCHVSRTPMGAAMERHRSYASGEGAAVLTDAARAAWSRAMRWARPVAGWQPPAMFASEPQSVQLPVSVHRQSRPMVRFAAVSGLPDGLELSADGELTGTPSRAGTSTLVYTVTNSTPEFDHPVRGTVQLEVKDAVPSRLSAGGEHSCTIRAEQSLWCWGDNQYGQIGNDVTGPGPASPVRVGIMSDWTSVVAGGAHTCGTRSPGELHCWGLNHQSQLGLGNRQSRSSPTRVGTADDWRTLSLGWFTTCGVRATGSLWCWGDNSSGQLGDGTTTIRREPRRVPGEDWRTVSTGGWHTCGIRADQSLWCWGRNSFGQVGDGTTRNRWSPVRVGPRSSWVDVSTSFTHTCATTARGDVRCWGRNNRGQLGTGFRSDRSAPAGVEGLPPMVEVAAGEGSTCALDSEATAWCWGSNAYGFFGDGGRTSSLTPVAVGSGQTRLTAGWLHRCAMVAGSVTCWGNDERGQLGDGTRTAVDAAIRSDSTGDDLANDRAAAAGGTAIRMASFNVLGDVHTAPYAHDDSFAPHRIRAEWSRDLLDRIGAPDIIGTQEVAPTQLDGLDRALGGQFEAWPGNEGSGSVQMSLLWRKSVWEALEKQTITIPFIEWQREAPVVRLRHRVTGRQIWVINVHNAPRDLQQQRDRAVRIETDKIRELRQSKLPVFFMGDMNEKQRVFCTVLSRTDLDSPAGGSYENGTCQPPRVMRIDWIFGSPEAEWSGFSYHVSPLKMWVNDHRIAVTTATLP